MLILLVLIFQCLKADRNTSETFSSMTEPGSYLPENKYIKSINELNDVNTVLKRPIKAGDSQINSLRIANSYDELENHDLEIQPKGKAGFNQDTGSEQFNFDGKIRNTVKPPYSDPELFCISSRHAIKKYVKKYQPFMFQKPKIVDYYGSQFYYDWRYPQKPVSLKFLANPMKYCRDNPEIYPCYTRAKDLNRIYT